MMKIKDTVKSAYRFVVLMFFIAGIVCFCCNSVKMVFVGLTCWGFCFIPALIWNARNDYFFEYEGDDNEAAEEIDER